MTGSSPRNISQLAYIATSMLPCFLFMIVSIPVKRRNIIQEICLFLLWVAGLSVPLYYAGKLSYASLISSSVFNWATSMKMGVWLFSMTMEERRQCPFAITLTSWRRRPTIKNKDVEEEKTGNQSNSSHTNISLISFIIAGMKHVLIADIADISLHLYDINLPIHVFSAIVHKFFGYLGFSVTDTGFSLSLGNILISTLICVIFSVYLQMQLQVTYDSAMIIFSSMYKLCAILEKWQLNYILKENYTKDVEKSKALLKRVHKIRAVKTYFEETIYMPPAFNEPWSAHSLRDFWGRRWHTYYNECFYRLGYQPIRLLVKLVSGRKPPRWLPALSVFVMSGLMHEYFLYVATGPTLYFHGSPLPTGFFQFLFFVCQVVFISIGDKYFKEGPLGRLFAIVSMFITCHLFVVPYFESGYMYMPQFSFYRIAANIYRGNPSLLDSVFK